MPKKYRRKRGKREKTYANHAASPQEFLGLSVSQMLECLTGDEEYEGLDGLVSLEFTTFGEDMLCSLYDRVAELQMRLERCDGNVLHRLESRGVSSLLDDIRWKIALGRDANAARNVAAKIYSNDPTSAESPPRTADAVPSTTAKVSRAANASFFV